MAERPRKPPTPSRKLKFAPKAPVSKQKKTTARSSTQQEAEEEYVIDRDIMTRLRTRQATAAAAGTDGDSADQKPQSSSSSSQADLQSQADNYGPCITLPMRPDNTNSEEFNKEEFGQPSLTSSEMEASINAAKDLGLEKESDDQRMILFKFPPLPVEIPSVNTEETDSKGNKEKESDDQRMLLFKFPPLPLEIPAAVNTEETDSKGNKKAKKVGSNLQQLPPGHVGKMLIYKSGKVEMKLGDVIFDVSPGVKYLFHEEAVATNANEKHFCELGSIQQHAVVTPDVDDLLKGSKN